MSDAAAATPALTPEQTKKQHKKLRQRTERAARHAALAARVAADRSPTGTAEAEAGTVAIAVPAEVNASLVEPRLHLRVRDRVGHPVEARKRMLAQWRLP